MRVDQFEQLVIHRLGLLLLAAAQNLRGAVVQVIAHQISRHAAQRFLHAGHLRDDVRTVAVFLNHFLQAADLPFNAAKAMPIGRFNFRIDANRFASRMRVASAVRARWMQSLGRL